MSDEIVIKLFDYDFFVSDAIGICSIKMSSLCINGGGEANFPIYYGQEKVGSLKLLSMYTPSQLQTVNIDNDNVESIKRELENQNNINNYFETNLKIEEANKN